MDRREFIKKSLTFSGILGAGYLMGNPLKLLGATEKEAEKIINTKKIPDLVAVKGAEPQKMFDLGIKAYGGMKRFVKKNSVVLVKPNIGWNSTPELAANTNPKLVGRIIEHCYNAGAKKVYVFDHTCNFWKTCYDKSYIKYYAELNKAIVVPGSSEKYYEEVEIAKGKKLKNNKVHEVLLESDTFINVPVLKHHGGARITIAMKNLMGVVWDRRYYHRTDLHQCIADFCTFRKPDLNVIDAYRVMMKNGPRGSGRKEDITLMKMQVISSDIVAVDTAAAKIFGKDPNEIEYIKAGQELELGTMNLSELNIKKIAV